MSDHPYQTRDSRIVWHNPPWYTLRQDDIRLPDGSDGTYTIIERPGAVWIVPVLEDGQLVLIRNYRYTIDQWLWEVPAGNLDPDLPLAENARRELAEEIGGKAASLERIGEMYTMPGICNEKGFFFLARGVRLGEPRHEPTEIMERHIFPTSKVQDMLRDGAVADGPSALALMLAMMYLGLA